MIVPRGILADNFSNSAAPVARAHYRYALARRVCPERHLTRLVRTRPHQFGSSCNKKILGKPRSLLSKMDSTFESFGHEDFDVKNWVNAQVLSSHSLAVASGNAKGTRCVCFVGDHGFRIRGTKGWANTIRDVCDALGTIWDQARVLPDTKLHGVSATPWYKTARSLCANKIKRVWFARHNRAWWTLCFFKHSYV